MHWIERPIVMIDTETTGLAWTTSRVIEVAAIAFRLTSDPLVPEFMTSFETLIHPGPIALADPETIEALEINHISRTELEQASPFPEAVGKMVAFMDEVAALSPDGTFSVSAFNAEFDHRMLAAEWLRTGLTMPTWLRCQENWNSTSGWIDPLVWCRDGNKYAKGGHSLPIQRTRLGLTPDGAAHRALTDVKDAAKVLNWLTNGGHAALTKARTPGQPFSDREELLAWQDVLSAGQSFDKQSYFFKQRQS